ncbi:MAG: C-terminal binding protein [Proteobacteria bacterium]|nr:C-terminal binding protein [Pseudomonadota bacterium]
MSFKVVKVIDLPQLTDNPQPIEELGGEFIKQKCSTEEDVLEIARDADYLVTIGHICPIKSSTIKELEYCRFVQTLGAGYDGIDVKAATAHGIGVVNIPEFCTDEVSDHMMGLILACSRRITQMNRVVKQTGAFEGAAGLIDLWMKAERLEGKTLGFIGLGSIARAAIPKARGFDMTICAYDPYLPKDTAGSLGVTMKDMKALLQTSDFVVVSPALTPENRHMIGMEQLKQMKPGAYLINTSRGPLVDHSALARALEKGYIAGAALDVTEPEPLPPDSPLLKLDNVILTGHTAWASPRSWNLINTWHIHEAVRVMRGEWPIGLVNPEVKDRPNVRGPLRQDG